MLTFPSAPQRLNHAGLPFTTIPNEVLNNLPNFSPSELTVLLYICRRTLGYHKLSDTISYDQFLHGITSQDGRRLDRGAGVSRRALMEALRSLERRGFILRHSQGLHQAVLFELNLDIYQTNTSQEQNCDLVPENDPAQERQNCDLVQKGQNCDPWNSYEEQNCDLVPQEQIYHLAQESNPLQEQNCDPWNSHEGQIYHLRDNYKEQNCDLVQPAEEQNCGLAPGQEGQILPFERALAGQKSNPSKEKLLNQNINRSGGQELAAASQLLEQNISGLTPTEAYRLADICLRRYRRDLLYISRLVDYVNLSSNVRNPAALITSLINTNADRTPSQPTRSEPAGIDFSQYREGGKYGYLTRPRQEYKFELSDLPASD